MDSNEITIDIEKLLLVDDNSITDCETIRQIGLLSCTRNDVSKENRYILYGKVDSRFAYKALYPHVMKSFDILPEGVDKSLFDELYNKRRK